MGDDRCESTPAVTAGPDHTASCRAIIPSVSDGISVASALNRRLAIPARRLRGAAPLLLLWRLAAGGNDTAEAIVLPEGKKRARIVK